jgi:preprotein translocase subunit SecA
MKSRDQVRLDKISKSILPYVGVIYQSLQGLKDEELAILSDCLRKEIIAGNTSIKLRNEAFALVKEAVRRTLGYVMYDVQLMGGCVLCEGSIAEMKTGEGKTIVALLPAYWFALQGKGVHLITVNEYLARVSKWQLWYPELLAV